MANANAPILNVGPQQGSVSDEIYKPKQASTAPDNRFWSPDDNDLRHSDETGQTRLPINIINQNYLTTELRDVDSRIKAELPDISQAYQKIFENPEVKIVAGVEGAPLDLTGTRNYDSSTSNGLGSGFTLDIPQGTSNQQRVDLVNELRLRLPAGTRIGISGVQTPTPDPASLNGAIVGADFNYTKSDWLLHIDIRNAEEVRSILEFLTPESKALLPSFFVAPSAPVASYLLQGGGVPVLNPQATANHYVDAISNGDRTNPILRELAELEVAVRTNLGGANTTTELQDVLFTAVLAAQAGDGSLDPQSIPLMQVAFQQLTQNISLGQINVALDTVTDVKLIKSTYDEQVQAGETPQQAIQGTFNALLNSTILPSLNTLNPNRPPTPEDSTGPVTSVPPAVTQASIRFLGGTVDSDVRLIYRAGLGRFPDEGGQQFWTNTVKSGTSLSQVADGFLKSTEFQSLYGSNLGDTQYVVSLYNNILGRDPDPGGRDFWVSRLQQGASKPDVLVGMSTAAENKARVTGFDGGSAYRLYTAALGRLPDAGGLQYWTQQLTSGQQTLLQEALGFLNSGEFTSKYGGLSSQNFVQNLYGNVLGRQGNAQEVSYWSQQIDATQQSRARVVLGFSESPEYQAKLQPDIDKQYKFIA